MWTSILLFTSHFNRAFSLFEQPRLKIKFSIIKIPSKIIVSLPENPVNDFFYLPRVDQFGHIIIVVGRTAADKKASQAEL